MTPNPQQKTNHTYSLSSGLMLCPGSLLFSHHIQCLAPCQTHQGLSTHCPLAWNVLPHVLPGVTHSPLRGLCSNVSFPGRPLLWHPPPLCVAALLYCVHNTHHHATYLISVSSLSTARTGAQGVWGVGRGLSICSIHCHLLQCLEQCLANSRHLVIVY